MEINEIKKALYKEKPNAYFEYIRKGSAYYKTTLENNEVVFFEIPVNDMGESDFINTMDAKLLIRWILK